MNIRDIQVLGNVVKLVYDKIGDVEHCEITVVNPKRKPIGPQRAARKRKWKK